MRCKLLLAPINCLLLCQFGCWAQENDQHDVTQKEHDDFKRLVDWIRTNGGRVDNRLEIGIQTHNGREVRGIVAKEFIEVGSELLFSPWELVFGTDGATHNVLSDKCAILNQYAAEVRLGQDSFWFPYLTMDGSLSTRIPTLWGEEAISETQGLPPFHLVDDEYPSITDWYCQTCADRKPFEEMDDSV